MLNSVKHVGATKKSRIIGGVASEGVTSGGTTVVLLFTIIQCNTYFSDRVTAFGAHGYSACWLSWSGKKVHIYLPIISSKHI